MSASSMSGSGSLGGSGSLIGGRPGSVEKGGGMWMGSPGVDQREASALHGGHAVFPHSSHMSHSSHSSHSTHEDGGKRRSR